MKFHSKLNVEHTLFPYQQKDMERVVKSFSEHDKVCFQASTGYGKTYSFCTIAKWYKKNYNKKSIILCNREELVQQSVDTLNNIGLTAEKIIPNKKTYHHISDVYVAMEQTLYNKLQKDPNFLENVGLVIIDECHIQFGVKHFEYFKDKKLLGFTATPIIYKKETYFICDKCNTEHPEDTECCNIELMEWSRPITMSMYYDTIVVGTNISELIEYGQIVKEINFTVDVDLSNLKTDSSGEYTSKSLESTFNNSDVIHDVLLNYENIALGKRTIIFTSSTKNNVTILNSFLEKGYNAKLLDSVNVMTESRKSTIDWFNNTPDAILINTSTLTTGFDSKEVECIILNRATTSLSLYLQMVGRGARSSQKIYKDSFIVIDLGGNVKRFGAWSDSNRDWEDIFYNGTSKPKAKLESIEMVKECKGCGALIAKNLQACDICNEPIEKAKKHDPEQSNEIAKAIELPNPPKGQKIIEYVKHHNGDLSIAIKILHNQMVDLFIYHGVTKELYLNTKRNGNLKKKITKICRPIYFLFVKSDLEYGNNIKLDTFLNKIENKIDKHYEKKK